MTNKATIEKLCYRLMNPMLNILSTILKGLFDTKMRMPIAETTYIHNKMWWRHHYAVVSQQELQPQFL